MRSLVARGKSPRLFGMTDERVAYAARGAKKKDAPSSVGFADTPRGKAIE